MTHDGGEVKKPSDNPAMWGHWRTDNLIDITILMKMHVRASWMGGVAVAGLLASSAAAQEVVYDNTQTPLNTYFASQGEFGDQVTIEGGGWLLHSFSFEYFASGLGGGETARVRVYANNGIPTDTISGAQAPGELLWQSPVFPLRNGNTPIQIIDLASLNVSLPNTFTWTVVPSGVTGTEVFGLNLYDLDLDNPARTTVGTSFDDLWKFGASGWELVQIPGTQANFGALVVAVPEPGVGALLAVGGLALALRRRSSSR